MTTREQYTPGAANGAQVRKDGEKWTLILVRELRHTPEKVWQALIDPAQLREWAPFEADGSLATAGATVNLTWVGTGRQQVTTVTRAEAPEVLEAVIASREGAREEDRVDLRDPGADGEARAVVDVAELEQRVGLAVVGAEGRLVGAVGEDARR